MESRAFIQLLFNIFIRSAANVACYLFIHLWIAWHFC